MTFNKAYYYEQGAKYARDEVKTISAAACADNRSWQAIAFNKGFDANDVDTLNMACYNIR